MKDIIVLDNFYQTPEAIRNYALYKTEYLSKESMPLEYPGVESKKSFYSKDISAKLENLIGKKITVDSAKNSFGVFVKSLREDQMRKTIHVDSGDWTGIVYLSRPEDCQGGTTFYQHIESNLNHIPCETVLKKQGYHSRQDFIDRFLTPKGRELAQWKTSAHVTMKFNRLLLFRSGKYFHAADSYFGETDENCRLLQLFFFHEQE